MWLHEQIIEISVRVYVRACVCACVRASVYVRPCVCNVSVCVRAGARAGVQMCGPTCVRTCMI